MIKNSVLLLKSQISDDDKYEALLKSKNFDVVQVKTLDFTYKNLPKLREKLENWEGYSGLILSSPRCVQAVQLSCDFLESWKTKDNFVVGEATHKAALAQLGLDCLGEEAGNAENLSRVICESKSKYTKPFLFPHGNLKTDTLNLELDKQGLTIDSVEVYETIANPKLEQDLSRATNNFQTIPEFVVFFSPSGFNSCIDLIQRVPVEEVKLIAIGPVTQLAISERNLKVFGTAKRPNPEELLNVVLSQSGSNKSLTGYL